MKDNMSVLQTGNDIRGIAVKNTSKTITLTPERVKKIAVGFMRWMIEEKKIVKEHYKISIGIDSRISGEILKQAFVSGLESFQCDIYDCGLSTTPAMFMSTVMPQYLCDGAVMITASHLPYEYNGLKIFTNQGGCEAADIKKILKFAAEVNSYSSTIKAKKIKTNLIADYAKILVDKVCAECQMEVDKKILKNFKIIVDAGNGAGGFFATKVLSVLGADIDGSQFLEPDGFFPNHIANPEDKEAMQSIQKAVQRNKADLGIIFDTDVDRVAIVGHNGMEINRNSLIALTSAIILKNHPSATIVTDSVTSDGLHDFIEQCGGIHHRFKRGYKNVINEAKRLNKEGVFCPLAIETSGHAALKENYFLDDGAYLVVKLLSQMVMIEKEGMRLEKLISALKYPAESKEIRVPIQMPDFYQYGETILSDFKSLGNDVQDWKLESKNFEGVRFNINTSKGKSWILIRMSLHEPLLVINVESSQQGEVGKILKQVRNILQNYDALNLEKLNSILQF